MHSVASKTERDPQEIKAMLSQRLLLLAPEQTERLIQQSGFQLPQRFFQSLLIHGWMAKKAQR
jgi:tRNA (cmo5U34)-methyltransferase